MANDWGDRYGSLKGMLFKGRLGCLPSLVLFSALGVVAIMLLDLAFAPWIYSVGGRVRLVPIWAGSGVVSAPWGPYRIYLSFSPSPTSSHLAAGTSVEGGGWVCTPQGERYRLRVTGGASGHIWNNMDGHNFSVNAYYRPFTWQYRREDRRPSLSFSGRWVGPNLVMNDNGSIAAAFKPDGTLKSYRESVQSDRNALILPVVLTEADWRSAFDGCRSLPGF